MTAIEDAARYKRDLIARETEAVGRVIDAYQRSYKLIKADLDALLLKIGSMESPTRGQVERLKQFKELLDDIQEELTRFGGWYGLEIDSRTRAAIVAALADARGLTALSAGTDRILDNWRVLNPDVIEQLLGFLDPKGVLYKTIGEYPGVTAKAVADAILDGISRGWNPVKTASQVLTKLGMPLTSAIRTMRTVQLWAYRETSRASYIANSDVVGGWIWLAELDSETCASCIVQHGTFHDNTETLDDHWNGRCAMYPVTITNPNPDVEKGSDWFEKQGEKFQREVLGEKRYEAWKDGGIELDQLSVQHDEPTYGSMRFEASLKELGLAEE